MKIEDLAFAFYVCVGCLAVTCLMLVYMVRAARKRLEALEQTVINQRHPRFDEARKAYEKRFPGTTLQVPSDYIEADRRAVSAAVDVIFEWEHRKRMARLELEKEKSVGRYGEGTDEEQAEELRVHIDEAVAAVDGEKEKTR